MKQHTLFFSLTITVLIFITASCQTENRDDAADTKAIDTSTKAISHKKMDTPAKSPVFPGADAFQLSCELIQDQAETLLEEYYRKGTSDERLEEIINDLNRLDKNWKEKDCQQVFGHMIPKIPNSPHKIRKNNLEKLNSTVK
jgi:hypothetical protein